MIHNYRRRGVTIADTLMAGAIGAAMLGLLLPAISAAIANSQGSHCRNNLARLGVALNAYHDALGKFPPGTQSQTNPPTLGAEQGDLGAHGASWTVCLLPFMGEQAVYDQFNFSRALSGGLTNFNNTTHAIINGAATASDIYALRCPADTGFDIKYQVNRNPSAFTSVKYWQYYGRSNYAANACLIPPFNYGTFSPPPGAACGGPNQISWSFSSPYSWKTRGVMGYGTSLSRSQITDGTSKTILLGEMRIGINAFDPRGIWADGTAAASTAWWHLMGPNSCSWGDDLNPNRYGTLLSSVGSAGQQAAAQQCMYFYSSQSGNPMGNFKSQHSGGIFVVMCDGSVRFISNSVQVGNAFGFEWALQNNAAGMGTWQRLNASGDGLVVDDSSDPNFSSTVVPFVFGDMNGDGVLDNFDIAAFELALADPAAYLTIYPNLTDYQQRGDINNDGTFDNFDMGAFEALLTDLL